MLADSFNADSRYFFTGQFLEASAMFVRRARAIEADGSAATDDAVRCEHRGLVCAAIMQCAAALETESHEICTHGPGSHLGSNGTDGEARKFLRPVAKLIDDQSTLERFDLILHLLRREPLEKGANPYQSAALVVRLRNEIVHYKSRWGSQLERVKLYASLRSLHLTPPPFADSGLNFFPHRCLGAECGAWALASVVAFLDKFYVSLGITSCLDGYRARLTP